MHKIIFKRTILVIFLLLLVISLSFAIFWLNPKSNNKLTRNEIDLNGYTEFKAKLDRFSVDNQDLAQFPPFQKMIINIKSLENQKLSKQEELKTIKEAKVYLIDAYAGTNDHRLYSLQKEFNDFIVLNFPNESKNIRYECFDPECAEAPSTEINNIIAEIKESKLPDYIKENDIQNLTNFSYLNNNSAEEKAGDFLIVADLIKKNPEYITLGINNKIADEIEKYVKNTFPKEYRPLNTGRPTPPVPDGNQ